MEASVLTTPRKSPTENAIQEKKKAGRGANCTLDIVLQFLKTGQCPKGYSKNDKRALKRRAQSFVIIDNVLYYTGGRSRHCNGEGEEETAENPERYPDYTQVLRKCCLTEEEKQEAVTRAHVGEDGTHYGMERTTERISSQFYWLGIIHSVRNTIHNCSNCASRSRGPSSTTNIITLTASCSVQDGDNDDAHEEAVKVEKPEVYFTPQETCSCFWQKVEVQVFGPYPAGKENCYVAVSLDTYSQYPEAAILQSVTTASLTNFILKLVCRYGMMERLVILQNQVTKGVDMTINMHEAGIFITQLYSLACPTDERWRHVEKSLQWFVSFYPTLWDKCLEAFMVPLRISLPHEAEYSPTYLTYGREPNLPEQLNHRSQEGWQTEIRLSEEQEQQTVELLMRAFGVHFKTPSVQPASNSDVKSHPQAASKGKTLSESNSAALSVPASVRRKSQRGRRWKEQDPEFVVPEDSEMKAVDDDDLAEEVAIEYDAPYVPPNEGTPSIRSSKRKRTVTYKVKEELLSRKQKLRPTSTEKNHKPAVRQPTEQASKDSAVTPAKQGQLQKSSGARVKKAVSEKREEPPESPAKIASTLGMLALDVYYFILRQYKEKGTYPPQVSHETRQDIQQLSEMVELREGKLYSCHRKSAGRVVITQEKARFSLLRKAHVIGEMHYDRNGGLKHLLEMNVFWRGMSLDLDAFIHVCPECVHSNPLHNKAVVQIPTKSKVLPADRDDSDPHMSEDEEEASSYEDLIQYLTDSTFPSTLSEDQQACIRLRANSFCIVNGSLHYQPLSSPSAPPRQVLFAESCCNTAIREAHIEEDGSHLSQQDTQAKLREKYFWSGMTYDVIHYISNCCMKGSSRTQPIPHRNPVIQKRVEKFRNYYLEGIPTFDKSILMDSSGNADKANADNNGQEGGETTSTSEASSQQGHTWMEDDTIRNAVESIIAEMGGTQTHADLVENTDTICITPLPVLLTKSGKVRSRRDCHKCHHCGRIISGSVAFKVHLYKHTGVKPFSCSVCGKTFTTRKSQQVHMRKHTGVRPYLCNQCGREFFRGTSFRYHLKSHTRGKVTPLPCDLCNRTFATQNRLDRHKEFKHPAVPRVYMCNQCGKVFTAARSLKWHEQSHTGVRKHQCQYCSKSFVRREVLDNHLKMHLASADWTVLASKHDQNHQAGSTGELTVSISQPGGEVLTISATHPSGDVANVIQWTDEEQRQATDRITQQNLIVTDLDVYQGQMEHTTTHVLTAAQVHPAVHLTATSLPPHSHASIHPLHTELLLHEAVPVQYEVECLSGDPSALAEADLNAVHMLAHASLGGQNIMQHLSDRT